MSTPAPAQSPPPQPPQAPPTAPAQPGEPSPSSQQPPSEKTPQETSEDTVDVDKDGLAEKGSFNHVKGVLGRPGSGKSYYAAECMREFVRQKCYVLCHDIGWRLPEFDASGKPFGIVRHENVQSAVSRLASDPSGIHCISSPDASQVIALGKVLAAEDMKRNGGTKGHPVVIGIDEVVAAGVCDPNYISDDMRGLIAGRRHMNIGIIYTCQSARMVHNQLIGLSTEMVFFNLVADADLDKLEKNGIPAETIGQIKALPKYKHIDHRFS